MTRALRAESLRDFAPDGWWAVFNAFVDGDASASPSELVARVRAEVRPGDLRVAAASYGTSDGDLDEGARLLTERILATLAEQHVIEQTSAGTWQITPAYLGVHQLPGGGIRFAYNVDGNWTAYTAAPKAERHARGRASSDRLNTNAAIIAAANYRRPVRTGEERSAKKNIDARAAAFELYSSMLEHGYLDAFPVTVNKEGRVVAGNHRLRFAGIARAQLQLELEREQRNGADPIVIADLEHRITSLEQRRILARAVVVGTDADEIRVTTASEIQIPWAEHEKKALAAKLTVDGWKVAEIAARLRTSERNVREWTKEERTDLNATRKAEATRLAELGWSQRQIATHLGVGHRSIGNWVGNSGERSETAQQSEQVGKPPRVSDQELAVEADRFLAEGGTSSRKLGDRLRAAGRGSMQLRIDVAWREAKQRQQAAKQRERLTGAPVQRQEEPASAPTHKPAVPPTCPACGQRIYTAVTA